MDKYVKVRLGGRLVKLLEKDALAVLGKKKEDAKPKEKKEQPQTKERKANMSTKSVKGGD